MDNNQSADKVTLPGHIPWVFSGYIFLDYFKRVVSTTFLMFFVTEYTGINMVAYAGVMTFVRIADFFCSLIAGALIQKTNSRFGAIRPWLVGSSFFVWLGCAVCFWNPDIDTVLKLAMVCGGYMIDSFSMNFLTASNAAIIPKLAGSSAANRVAVTAKRAQGNSAARIISNLIMIPLVMWFVGNEQNGYFIVTNIFGVIGFTGALLMFVMIKDYDKYNPDAKRISGSASTVKLGEMFAYVFKNPTCWALFLSESFNRFGETVIFSFAAYYFRYSAKNMNYQTISGTVANICAFAASILFVALARKLGKRNSSIFSNFGTAFFYCMIAFFTDGNPILYIIFFSCTQITRMILNIHGATLWLDIAEVQLHETGKDNRPFAMSLTNLSWKIAYLGETPIIAFILSMSNYQVINNVGTIPDTSVFVMYYGLTPAILYALAGLVIVFGYKINEKRARECALLNAKAEEEKKAALASGVSIS